MFFSYPEQAPAKLHCLVEPSPCGWLRARYIDMMLISGPACGDHVSLCGVEVGDSKG